MANLDGYHLVSFFGTGALFEIVAPDALVAWEGGLACGYDEVILLLALLSLSPFSFLSLSSPSRHPSESLIATCFDYLRSARARSTTDATRRRAAHARGGAPH